MFNQLSSAAKLTGFLEGISGWALYGLFRVLPIRWCSALGAKIGRFQGAERRIAIARIQKSLCWILPSTSQADRLALSNKILKNAGRSYFETMIVDRLLENGHVDTNLPEHVRKQLTQGNPLILVTVHVANLGDLISATLSNLLFRNFQYQFGTSPTRPIANRLIQGLSLHIRGCYLNGTPGHGSNPEFKTARGFVKGLLKPRSFVILHLDEAYDRQIHFPTFGRPIDQRGNVIKAIKLAARTGALVQPVFMTRAISETDFKLSWLPSFHVESDDAPLNKDTVLHHAQQLNELFEPLVFENLVDWAQICYLRSK